MNYDYQRIVDWVDDHIVERPGKVILAFLLVTAVFAVGLGNVSTESGTQQFAEDIPAQDALDQVNDEFLPVFGEDTGSTQLIQRDPNVLSKQSLLQMLRTQERIEEKPTLRVSQTSSAAAVVAQTIDPQATTLDRQITTLEQATQADVRAAVRQNADNPAFTGTLSNDFNKKSASASSTIGVVKHSLTSEVSSSAGQSGSSPLTPIQQQIQRIVATTDGDITVFGTGIIADEFGAVISDSLLIVTPAAVILIVMFLVIAYRDLLDLLLGTFALAMAVIWTFGFLGLAGIPFNQIMIAVPPLLLAVGIDFGIHAINRYREDRETGLGIEGAMRVATDQLLVAFFIVTGTTVIGFLSNLASDLQPIRDFGVVAGVGITFTFLIFGVFLPAAKVWMDRRKESWPIPTFSQKPLGEEGSALGDALSVGVTISNKIPVIFLVLTLLISVGAAGYATGVDTSFSQEDFLPPEDVSPLLTSLPEPFAPSDYSVVGTLNFLEDKFTSTQGGTVTIYVEGRMENEVALEQIYRAGEDPPESFVSENRRAESTSIVTVIKDYAARDPEFRRLVERNDVDDNGVPDDNLGEIYDYLETSPVSSQADRYLAEDHRSARVVYTVSGDASDKEATEDARIVADRFRSRYDATATGNTVVFQEVSDLIFSSAVTSLILALGGTVVFLVFIYWLLDGLPSIALANLVPIVVAVAGVAGTMRLLGISFNAFTATILSLTIGLGIDYSVHVVHRFLDERKEADLQTALERTVVGTGGALMGSMFTTAFGIGVLVLSVLSVLGQFGVLTALSIVYSFVASLVVLPSALVVWDRFANESPDVPMVEPGSETDDVESDSDSDPLATDGGERIESSRISTDGSAVTGAGDDDSQSSSSATSDGGETR
ncbi:MMPL family transporter [Halogeometricum borinquense]|uniref:MMPL family transporter n=1 Tax=Halogeometricum borinquense TaxID=60847 RepID=A0A6C0UIM2_9EURY|nr:MMPL family transporter [Halogeometricum borinquense]QIB74131.1 MMPL family transporter [Halogeometricum borinquense]QIQ76661.1 MMPL family transporter [Halogeometricum borinquense]